MDLRAIRLKKPFYDPKRVRVFLSYSTIDKSTSGKIKQKLDHYGFEVFLAHNDIEPSQNWINEIINNLKNCDIFVPFLTQNSQNSFWVNQEIGIAFALDKLIMPLKTDLNPWGFINNLQAQPLDQIDDTRFEFHIDRASEKIRKIASEKFPDKINDSLIYALGKSESYLESHDVIRIFPENENFSNQQINELFRIFLLNDQATNAELVRKYVKKLVINNRSKTDPQILNILKTEFPNLNLDSD